MVAYGIVSVAPDPVPCALCCVPTRWAPPSPALTELRCIRIQVLQEDGSVLSCALNAACAALVDAGVPMTSMYCECAGPGDGGRTGAGVLTGEPDQ